MIKTKSRETSGAEGGDRRGPAVRQPPLRRLKAARPPRRREECPYPVNNTSARRVPDAPCRLPTEGGADTHGMRRPEAGNLHYCTDAENTPRTCHFLPLFAPRGSHRWWQRRAVYRIGTEGWGVVKASSRGARKKWQMRAEKWHKSTPSLFTMFGDRAEDGERRAEGRTEGKGQRTEITAETREPSIRLAAGINAKAKEILDHGTLGYHGNHQSILNRIKRRQLRGRAEPTAPVRQDFSTRAPRS